MYRSMATLGSIQSLHREQQKQDHSLNFLLGAGILSFTQHIPATCGFMIYAIKLSHPNLTGNSSTSFTTWEQKRYSKRIISQLKHCEVFTFQSECHLGKALLPISSVTVTKLQTST